MYSSISVSESPSPSLSGLQGSVPICPSRLFESRSPSLSVPAQVAAGAGELVAPDPPEPVEPPEPPPTTTPVAATTGERRAAVYLLNFRVSTRSVKRVATYELPLRESSLPTEAGTLTTSLLLLALLGFAKAMRP